MESLWVLRLGLNSFINEAVKFPVAFFENAELVLNNKIFFFDACGDKNLINDNQFRVLNKFHGRILFTKELRPSFNPQSDSISAKILV